MSSSLRVYPVSSLCVVLLTTVQLLRHVHLRPTVILRECVDSPSSRIKKKSRSVSRPHMVAELVVATTEPGSLRECFGTSLESVKDLLRAATAGNASGSTARSDGTSAGSADATEQHELQLPQLPKTPDRKLGLLISESETSRRRLQVKRMSGKVGHSRCDGMSRRKMKNSTWNS